MYRRYRIIFPKCSILANFICSDTFGRDFWKTWGDGQAELCGYDLTIPRYGELRNGTAVAIFVTEDFNHAQRVKTDSPRGKGSGKVFPVMKLHPFQDFPTGIYDYNLMASVFGAREPVDGLKAPRHAQPSPGGGRRG